MDTDGTSPSCSPRRGAVGGRRRPYTDFPLTVRTGTLARRIRRQVEGSFATPPVPSTPNEAPQAGPNVLLKVRAGQLGPRDLIFFAVL